MERNAHRCPARGCRWCSQDSSGVLGWLVFGWALLIFVLASFFRARFLGLRELLLEPLDEAVEGLEDVPFWIFHHTPTRAVICNVTICGGIYVYMF